MLLIQAVDLFVGSDRNVKLSVHMDSLMTAFICCKNVEKYVGETEEVSVVEDSVKLVSS